MEKFLLQFPTLNRSIQNITENTGQVMTRQDIYGTFREKVYV